MFFRNSAKKQTKDHVSKLKAETKRVEDQYREADHKYMEKLGVPNGFSRSKGYLAGDTFVMVNESKHIKYCLEIVNNANDKKYTWRCNVSHNIDGVGNVGACVYGETATEAYNYARLILSKVC